MTITWNTPAGFLSTVTELTTASISVSATGPNITYSLLSGTLPSGLELNSLTGEIHGIPEPGVNVVRSKFVIRASSSGTVCDRFFYIDVEGPDLPVWSTPPGFLYVGVFGENYAMTKQWVYYNLAADPIEAPANTDIRYYIGEGDGHLPRNLRLDLNGLISGFIDDEILAEGDMSVDGGYDTEAYDVYPYDHEASFYGSTNDASLRPRIYQFTVTATDGIARSRREFIIVVTSMDILNFNPSSMPAGTWPALIPGKYYVQSPQFIHGSDLGTIRAENRDDISVQAYDPIALRGPTVYSIVTSTSIFTQIPYNLELDPQVGYLYGYIPYQPAYSKTYQLTVHATKTVVVSKVPYATASTTTSNTFTLVIKGQVESEIEWVSPANLGTIETGITSDLRVTAQHVDSDYDIKYTLIDGSLPLGLTLAQDGTIIGKVAHGATGTYTFSVLAGDVYETSGVYTTTSITCVEYDAKEYTKVYVKPFLRVSQREYYKNFTANEYIFNPDWIYRPYDPTFGVQYEIKVVVDFGLEKIDIAHYYSALRENFYRKRFYFGDVKKAIARTNTGTPIYEVIYVDIVDDMVNNQGISIAPVIYTNNDIYYPSSLDNMQYRLHAIPLEDDSFIGVSYENEPKFIQSSELFDTTATNFLRIVPICYALPGQGDKIINRIKLSKFDFKLIDFEIDRLILEESKEDNLTKYLIFERQALGDYITTDSYLFGPNWAPSPELTVRIDDEIPAPILRK